MTSRPGRIKQVIDVPFAARTQQDDLRATSEFARLRHEIWTLLRDETQRAESQELRQVAGRAPARSGLAV